MPDNETESTENAAGANEKGQTFTIQKVYVKDVSFETPNSPDVFLNTNWQPDINLNLQSSSSPLGDQGAFEVVLSITVTANLDKETTAYLCEIQQAGIFNLAGFDNDTLAFMLGSYCPNLLFPFAREAISDIVTRGGFPQLLLAPVNFEAMFNQQQQKKAEETVQ